jgi:hypothetical protein
MVPDDGWRSLAGAWPVEAYASALRALRCMSFGMLASAHGLHARQSFVRALSCDPARP